MAARNLYFGYYSSSAAIADPTCVETWEDGQGRQVQVTAVHASEHSAAQAGMPRDTRLVGRVLNQTRSARGAVQGSATIIAHRNPADRSRRF